MTVPSWWSTWKPWRDCAASSTLKSIVSSLAAKRTFCPRCWKQTPTERTNASSKHIILLSDGRYARQPGRIGRSGRHDEKNDLKSLSPPWPSVRRRMWHHEANQSIWRRSISPCHGPVDSASDCILEQLQIKTKDEPERRAMGHQSKSGVRATRRVGVRPIHPCLVSWTLNQEKCSPGLTIARSTAAGR